MLFKTFELYKDEQVRVAGSIRSGLLKTMDLTILLIRLASYRFYYIFIPADPCFIIIILRRFASDTSCV